MDLGKFEAHGAASPPPVPAVPSNGYAVDGNPATATPGTVLGEYWHYQLQAEMAGLITAAGQTPSHTVLTQLTAAVRALADERITYQFASSAPNPDRCLIGASGWQFLPSGLLVQWGATNVTCATANGYYHSQHHYWTGNGSITFPIAFPAAVCGALLTPGPTSAAAEGVSTGTPTLAGVPYVGWTSYDVSAALAVFWLAIGY